MALTVVMAQPAAWVACYPPSVEAAAETKAALAEVSVVCSHLSPDLVTSKAVLVVESLVSCHLSQAAVAMALVAVDCSAHETSTTTVPTIMVAAAMTDSAGIHWPCSGSSGDRNTRAKAANAAAFTPVDMKAVTIVGAPS